MKSKDKKQGSSARSGFTLIEVILVIVIVGILAGIALKGINPGKHIESANIVDAQSDITMLHSGLEMYNIYNGSYPSSLEGLLDSSKEAYPFISKNSIPKDPWGNPYVYSVPGSHNTASFDLSASGHEEKVNNWD